MQPDPDQARPSLQECVDFWKGRPVFAPIKWDHPDIHAVVGRMNSVFPNGGAKFGVFSFELTPFLHFFLSRNRFGDINFFRAPAGLGRIPRNFPRCSALSHALGQLRLDLEQSLRPRWRDRLDADVRRALREISREWPRRDGLGDCFHRSSLGGSLRGYSHRQEQRVLERLVSRGGLGRHLDRSRCRAVGDLDLVPHRH